MPVTTVRAAEESDSLWDKVKEQGAEWYDKAKEKAPGIYEDVKEKGVELYDNAKEKAPEIYEDAKEKVGEAQEKVQDFREKQEAEFWQKFEDQIGAPVEQNGNSSTESQTDMEDSTDLEDVSDIVTTVSEANTPEGITEGEVEDTKEETELSSGISLQEVKPVEKVTTPTHIEKEVTEAVFTLKCLAVAIIAMIISVAILLFSLYREHTRSIKGDSDHDTHKKLP